MKIDLKLKIKNLKFKSESGFTLIEVITVIAILVVIGSISGVILFTSLRGSSKTSTLLTLRQSGEGALFQMEKLIRNAKRFDGISTDGETYLNDCITPITGDFLKLTDFNDYNVILTCVKDAGPPYSYIKISSASAKDSVILRSYNFTDENFISLQTCSFSCEQSNNSEYPIININFSLLPTNNSTNLIEKSLISPVQFKNSVLMRNSF